MTQSAFETWLLEAPLWQIALAMLLSMVAASLIGWRLRMRYRPSRDKTNEAESGSQEGYIFSATLGLLALLTGFTFSIAIDRFDTRRERVLIEANAIGTTYLRAQLLDEPHRSRISALLRDYIDTRLELADAGPAERKALLQRNDRLVTDLWTATVAAFPAIKNYDFSTSFLETMNLVIDMDTARKVARRAHIPTGVLLVLFFYQLVTAAVLGYVLSGRTGRIVAILLFVLFGVSVLLIIDIDRPTSGSIRESQDAIVQVRDLLHTQPPATFDRFNSPGPAPPPR